MFTCFVYNVWKFFQFFLGDKFTLANFCGNLNKFMIENEMIRPKFYKDFISIFIKYDLSNKKAR